MAKNKKQTSKDKVKYKDYIVPFGTVVVPTKKENFNSLSFWGGTTSKKDTRNQVNSWGGLVPSYIQPIRPAVVVNERPFASMFNKNTNRNTFSSRLKKELPNRKLQGYNFSLGVPQNPLVIENADPRFRSNGSTNIFKLKNNNQFKSSGSTNIFKLKNEDPFKTGRYSPNIKRSGKMAEVRWIDMINKPKYKDYTNNPFKDSDGDGIMNMFDCRPGNLWYQGNNSNLEPNKDYKDMTEKEKKAYKSKYDADIKEQLKKIKDDKKEKVFDPLSLVPTSTLQKSDIGGRKATALVEEPAKMSMFENIKDSSGTDVFDAEGNLKKKRGSGGGRKTLPEKDKTVRMALEVAAKQSKELGKLSNIFIKGKEEEEKTKRKEMSIAESNKDKQMEEKIRAEKEARRLLAEQTKQEKVGHRSKQLALHELELELKKKEQAIKERAIPDKLKKELMAETKMMYKAKARAAKAEFKAASRRKKPIPGSISSLSETISASREKGKENIMMREAMVSRSENKLARLTGALDMNQKKYDDIKEISSIRDKEERLKAADLFKSTYGEDYQSAKLLSAKDEKEIKDALLKTPSEIKASLKEAEKVKKQEERKQKILGATMSVAKGLQRVDDITGGKMRRHVTKTFAAGFKDLGKKDMAFSRKITGRAKSAIGGFFSFGGIGGVGGNILTGGTGGIELGARRGDYAGDTMSEAEYARAAKTASQQTVYEDSGLFKEPSGPGGYREGSGRPEGTYKYGMPIDEYKAMKRSQEQARRIQEAIQEQTITQQMTANTQMALGLTPGVAGAQVFTDTMSGPAPMSPTTAGSFMAPGVTIGSGMDVVSGVMNLGGRPLHSSQRIFGGLHSEAKTAKIPWLPKDPVMIREQERLPTYFPDKDSAEIARNTQVFNVLSLPRGSPLTGAPGGQTYSYAGRIKEIKAPQTKNMIMQTQNDGIIKANPTMKANPWGLMIKNRLNFSESNIVDEDLKGNVISRDQIGGNIWNAPNMFTNDNRVTGNKIPFGIGVRDIGYGTTAIGSGRIPEYAREVTGYSTNGVYQAQQMGRYQLPPQTGSGNITIPYNDNLGVWNGKIQMDQPQVTGLGQTYLMQGGQQVYRDSLSGNPDVASANPYKGSMQERIISQRTTQNRQVRSIPKNLMQAREAAIREQQRLSAEEEYVKQVAVQEGLKETDALGGKGFAKPSPLMDSVKEMIYRKGPSDVEKQINELQSRYDGLSQAAAKEVEDIVPGSPLPLNMMSNAKGDFEGLPVALKQRVIEEEIYRKQVEQAQNQYNSEQARYQTDLKEQMRQAAAIRNTQMDAAKKAQAAAEQMLASSKQSNININTNTIQDNKQVQYLTGDILDPYYDETSQTTNTQNIINVEDNPNGYNTIKKKTNRYQNTSSYETEPAHYSAVVPDNVSKFSGTVPSGGSYGAG